MRKLRFAIACAVLGAIGADALAQGQQLTSNSYAFVKAVRERDGNKVTDMLESQPRLIGARDGDGNTALLIAVARQDPVWTGYFIGKGADVNIAGKGGDTPLIVAARLGFKDGVAALLRKKARVNAGNRMGETPLIVAVQNRQLPVVKMLLDAGADPDITDNAAGLSARDYAARDTRSRDILKAIEAKKPKASAAAVAR